MALLRNPRHELFARAISDGHSATQAHRIAGFSVDRANAGRLRHRDDVKARIGELTAQKTAAVEIAQLTAAEQSGVSALWVLRNLRRNCVLAARRGDIAASNRAAELIGRHLNLFIEKQEVSILYQDDSDAYLQKLLELVQAPVIEHEPAALSATDDGYGYGADGQSEAGHNDKRDCSPATAGFCRDVIG